MHPDAAHSFNFAAPDWLWALALIPALWVFYALFYRVRGGDSDLRAFADPHLLPHLMGSGNGDTSADKQSLVRPLALWSLVWALAAIAMAGPRWDYTEVKTYTPMRDLVILLDLSPSMGAQDVKPARVVRAREEIEDIANAAQGVNIALIAFDSVPHMITPLTDDKDAIIHLLPSLSPALSYQPGANLAPALAMAGDMLASAPGDDKHVLVIADGAFDDGDAAIYRAGHALVAAGVKIHAMGIGTPEGAPAPDQHGGYIRDGSSTRIFRLDTQRLQRVASDGRGIYVTADYFDAATKAVLAQVEKPAASGGETGRTARFWDERFYLFLLPAAFLLLPWFRRNAAFPAALALFLLLAQPAKADMDELFLNKDQQGQKALESKQFDKAEKAFDDPYRRGVAQYRAGDYAGAAKSFAEAQRPDIKDSAQYNLGNAQLMDGKVKDAIATYEDVLKKNPKQEDARHNLEIAKKMQEQEQQQQQQQSQNSQQQKNQDQQSQSQQNQSQQNQQKNQQQQSKSDQQQQSQQQSQQEQQKQDQQQAGQEKQQQGQKSGDEQKQQQDAAKAEQQKQEDQQRAEEQKHEQEQQQKKEQAGQDQQKQEQQAGQEKQQQEQKSGDGQKQQQDAAKAEQQKQEEQQRAEEQKREQEQQQQKEQAAQQGQQDQQKQQAEQQKQDNAPPEKQQHEHADEQGDAQQQARSDNSPDEHGRPKLIRRTPRDVDADQWLDRIQNDPESFLRNKFYIETMRQSQKGDDDQ